MTPERLAAIRAWSEHVPMQTVDIYTLIGHRLELLDEVDRLRAGIERAADNAAANEAPWDSLAARQLRALLDPTEGRIDE